MSPEYPYMFHYYPTSGPAVLTLNASSLISYCTDPDLAERSKHTQYLILSNAELGVSYQEPGYSSADLASHVLTLVANMPSLHTIDLRGNPHFAPESLFSIHQKVNDNIQIYCDFTYWLNHLTPRHTDWELANIHYFLLKWEMSENPSAMLAQVSQYMQENHEHIEFLQYILQHVISLKNKSDQFALQVAAEIQNPMLLHVFYNIIVNDKNSEKRFTEYLVYLAHFSKVSADPNEYVPRITAAISMRPDIKDDRKTIMSMDLMQNIVNTDQRRMKLK